MKERDFKQMVVDEFLALVEDPRVDRTRKHPLETILVISLMAVICGADGFVGIERFATAKENWLAGFLDMPGGVPSHISREAVRVGRSHRASGAAYWAQPRGCASLEESAFATVRLRTRVTKGPDSRAAGLAMVFKPLLTAEQTWRKLNGAELVPLVRAGVKFTDGVRAERDAEASTTQPTVAKSKAMTKLVQDAKVAA